MSPQLRRQGMVVFWIGFEQPNNKTEAEIDAAQALFSDQRTEKRELFTDQPTRREGFNCKE